MQGYADDSLVYIKIKFGAVTFVFSVLALVIFELKSTVFQQYLN